MNSSGTLTLDDTCRWCGLYHGKKCPAVKAMEFHPDGSIKRVEFFAPNDSYPVLAPPAPVIIGDPTCRSGMSSHPFTDYT